MNILWLAPHPLPDKEKMHPTPWITALASKLGEKGVRITVLTTGKRLEKPVESYNMGSYKLIALRIPSGYVDAISLFSIRIKIIERFLDTIINDFDLVHVHGTEFQFASTLMNRSKFDVPVIISIQGIISICKKHITDLFTIRRVMWEIGSFYERREIYSFKNFMCRTNWDKSSVLNINSSARLFHVEELIRPEFYESHGQASGSNILFSGGEFSIKGLERALIVFNKLLNESSIKLHVIGNCSWRFVEKNIRKHKLGNLTQENVQLHGMVSAREIVSLFQDCFCLYHPSLIDNSPNSICEAQLGGLPVIATNVGGVSSLIEDNITGILLDDDISLDHEKLKRLLIDRDFQRSLSVNAQKLARMRHNPATIITDVIQAYKSIAFSEKTKM